MLIIRNSRFLKMVISSLLILLLLNYNSIANAATAKCYESNVQTYFFSLLVPVEGTTTGLFTVPKSLNSDTSEDRLFGKPYPWERNNLWNLETRKDRFEQALIEIACLSKYGPAQLLAIQKAFLDSAPSAIKNTKLYHLLSYYLNGLLSSGLTVNSKLPELKNKITIPYQLEEIYEFLQQLTELPLSDSPPSKVLPFFENTPFSVYSDPNAWYKIRVWLDNSHVIDVADKIIKTKAALDVFITSQDIIITAFLAPILANSDALKRIEQIESAVKTQDANLWNDPAFKEAIMSAKNFLNESLTKQFISTWFDEIKNNAADLISSTKTLAEVQFSNHVISLINNQLVSHGFSALTPTAAGYLWLGIAALYQEFLIILGINQQMENAELSVVSSTIAKQLCNYTESDCMLRIPAMYGYFSSADYMVAAYDWSFCWGCSDTVEIWKEAKADFIQKLDYEWEYRCDRINQRMKSMPWISLLLLDDQNNAVNDLIAYYPFNGNAHDESGNNNHGVEHGGVSYVSGVSGQAASFDGIDDYIESMSNVNVNTGDPRTVSAWIYLKSTGTSRGIVSLRDNYLSGSEYITESAGDLYNHSDLISAQSVIRFDNGKKPTSVAITNENTIQLNTWYHIAGVAQNNNLTLYVNGSANLSRQTNFGTSHANVDNKIQIGRRIVQDHFNYFDGYIDEVRIYNRALSEAEIQTLYSSINSLTGKWNVIYTGGGGTTGTITFSNDGVVSGITNSGFNGIGTYTGSSSSFSGSMTNSSTGEIITFNGQIQSGTMTGTWSSNVGTSGTFTGTKT